MTKKTLLAGAIIFVLLVVIGLFIYRMDSDMQESGLYLKVTGLDCEDCPKKILDKVNTIEGVAHASFRDDVLFVSYSDKLGMSSKIIYNVCQLGFGAEDVSPAQKKDRERLRLLDFNMRYK